MDTSALLALLFAETGAEQVANVLPDALMSTVNLSETLGFYVRKGASLEEIASRLAELPIVWLPFSSEQAAIAAGLLPLTKQYGLSLGDRACIALAIEKNMPIYTADRVWGELSLPIPVIKIR
ncbi:MAG: hypothetical protein BWK73_22175 [Thiothrix lacustris]|uniref:PIN domain-containing protein n=1 Tax=Thiothrix lacustris TaxID=525917 RepID=A0A1Y1QN05_9GAMM|nr:MAG: hypothetical protein BWK73_22175 [Thiothrix lacustris]